MKSFEKLLLENKAWASEKIQNDPHYFEHLAEIQTPEFLWIGCSDSRVPANEITGTQPGEIFVHRNIANMVVNTDLNLLSVLEYAVNHLKVKNIIVCGHYGCGGVKASMTRNSFGILNKWLRNIKDVYRLHKTEIDAVENMDERVDLLTELNVKEQALNLVKTSIIQKSWKVNGFPTIHGWVYGLQNGIIKPIIEIAPGSHIDEMYEFDDL